MIFYWAESMTRNYKPFNPTCFSRKAVPLFEEKLFVQMSIRHVALSIEEYKGHCLNVEAIIAVVDVYETHCF